MLVKLSREYVNVAIVWQNKSRDLGKSQATFVFKIKVDIEKESKQS